MVLERVLELSASEKSARDASQSEEAFSCFF